jgi:hypothetical protein
MGWLCFERKIKVNQISFKRMAPASLKKFTSQDIRFEGPYYRFRDEGRISGIVIVSNVQGLMVLLSVLLRIFGMC